MWGVIFRRPIPIASRAAVAQVNDDRREVGDWSLVDRFLPSPGESRGEKMLKFAKSVKSEKRPVYSHADQLVNDMFTLDKVTAGEFLDRFSSFTDTLLRKIEICYPRGGKRSVTVWIAARDAKETANEGWVCVRLVISQAQDFCFADAANTTAAVISNGVHICWLGGIVGLDFGHFVDPPDDLTELKSSKCFVTGTSVDWTVEAY